MEPLKAKVPDLDCQDSNLTRKLFDLGLASISLSEECVLLPYSKLSLKKHFATLGTPTRQRVCYSSVSGQGDCNMQGAQQLLHPQAQYVSFLPARNLQSPNMEGRCSSSFGFSWNECMHMKVFLVVGPLMSTPFRPSPLCVSNGQRHQLL